MYSKKKNNSNEKSNNAGLSLVELLVAITILAIIIVPLLHTFVSSANTNGKAQTIMRATVTAENIMEEFKDKSMESLSTKYGVSANAAGVYTFDFDPTQLSEYGTDLYTAQVILDPNDSDPHDSYVSYNQVSVTDVDAITADNSAVYAIYPTYDNTIYDNFAARSTAAHGTDPSYLLKDASYFEQHLDRNITVNIIKGSMSTDSEGKPVQLVRITLVITYTYNENATVKALFSSDINYSESKELFDNSSSKKPLTGIYLMYPPRYKACTQAINPKTDIIQIKNLGNVETNLSIIREKIEGTSGDSAYLNQYLIHGASITVFEENVWAGVNYTSDTKASIKLRTNLMETHLGTGVSTLKCTLEYRNNSRSKYTVNNLAAEILSVRTADGKAMDGKAIHKRIYKMKISIYKNGDITKPIATLDGTKID